jgi:hypothetical protein
MPLLVLLVLLVCTSSGEAFSGIKIIYITKLGGEHLYLIRESGAVDIFNPRKNKLIRTIELTDSTQEQGEHPAVFRVVGHADTLYIQVGIFKNQATRVYQFRDEEFEYLGELPSHYRLEGCDNDYLYVVEIEYSRTPARGLRGFRYDRQLYNRTEYHFDKYPELIISSIAENGNKYWYGGGTGLYAIPNFEQVPFLVSRDKDTGESVLHYVGSHEFYIKDISVDEDSVWILGTEKLRGRTVKILKFSKKQGRMEKSSNLMIKKKDKNKKVPLSGNCRFVRGTEVSDGLDYLWLFSNGFELLRFNKYTSELTSFISQREVSEVSYLEYNNSYADEDEIWSVLRNYSGDKWKEYRERRDSRLIGHLLRISKHDASHEIIPVLGPFRLTSLMTAKNALYVLVAFIILTTVLSIVLGVSNIPKLRHMKLFLDTVLFIISTITLIIIIYIIAPSSEVTLLFSILCLMIPSALTAILISRMLTYLIKTSRFRKLSWILAISLSFFSCSVYLILSVSVAILDDMRKAPVSTTHGFGEAIVWTFLFSTPIVFLISLVVNIIERRSLAPRTESGISPHTP